MFVPPLSLSEKGPSHPVVGAGVGVPPLQSPLAERASATYSSTLLFNQHWVLSVFHVQPLQPSVASHSCLQASADAVAPPVFMFVPPLSLSEKGPSHPVNLIPARSCARELPSGQSPLAERASATYSSTLLFNQHWVLSVFHVWPLQPSVASHSCLQA